MTDFESGGLAGLPQQTAEAAAALVALQAPAEKAADAIDAAFSKAGASLTRSLARAASDGKISLGELAEAVLAAVTAAFGGGSKGLGDAIASAVSSVFSGARADGGPVTAGGAYLVGERGPELFRPSAAGEVSPVASGGLAVTVNVQGDAVAGLARSDTQLAQTLARAVSLGARRL